MQLLVKKKTKKKISHYIVNNNNEVMKNILHECSPIFGRKDENKKIKRTKSKMMNKIERSQDEPQTKPDIKTQVMPFQKLKKTKNSQSKSHNQRKKEEEEAKTIIDKETPEIG